MRDAILTLLFCAALFCALAAYRLDSWDWWYLACGLCGAGRALLPKYEREM